MAIGSVADRLAIRELLDRSCAAVIRKDPVLWGQTWVENGCWKLPSMDVPALGHEALISTFIEKMAYVDSIHMSAFPTNLEFEGNSAHGQAYCRESIVTNEKNVRYIIGCYHDNYVIKNGMWLFSSRKYEVISVL